MIQNVLRHMGGIENYGIISLILFFACFFGMLIWSFGLKKSFLNRMSRMPLDADPENSNEGLHRHD